MVRGIAIAFLTSLLCGSIARADQPNGDGYYQGALNGQPIVMALGTEHYEFIGKYRCLRHGAPIFLSRKITSDGVIRLTESDPRSDVPDAGGEFVGRLDQLGNYQGIWQSFDHKRTFHFALPRVAILLSRSIKRPRFEVSYTIPQFTTSAPFYETLNRKLRDEADADLGKSAADDRMSTLDPDGGPYPWQQSSSIEVISAEPSLVSLLIQDYDYSGGAHGNYGFSAITYNWQHGKVVEFSPQQSLSTDSAAAINERLIQDLKAQGAGWPEQVRARTLADYQINPTPIGLMFTFSPYEVDCYAAGEHTVLLPYRELNGLLLSHNDLSAYYPLATAK